ncbi:MAG: Mu transposase C-terminal domain-containing protein [Ferrovibrio sp.]|uniref:Mu transposase C-terminal domain-containing protein n=1 Tax=Ferrovibrio sp. TaxID=1917215 RepID=UPI00391B706C
MRTFHYHANLHIKIHDVGHRLVERTVAGEWFLIETLSGLAKRISEDDLNVLYVDGHLTLDETIDFGNQHATKSRPVKIAHLSISDLPEREQTRVNSRIQIIEELRQKFPPYSGQYLAPARPDELCEAIKEACAKSNHRVVSHRTILRWLRQLNHFGNDGLVTRYSDRRPNTLNPAVAQILRQEIERELSLAEDRHKVGARPSPSISALKKRVDRRVAEASRDRVEGPLRPPSTATIYNYWKQVPAFQRDTLKYGKARARMMYRAARGRNPEEHCLESVEYDETRLPIFFFDEDYGVPLGRGWLTWYLDVYSGIPTGFYLGFEPPSDLTISSALRHACLPKSYVGKEYPNIENKYLGMGIPRMVTFDNALSQHGRSIQEITRDLSTYYRFARVRTPWFKPVVERMFRTLNQALLQKMPGFVLGREIDPADYNPTENGCLGLRHFLYIFHKWLIDLYCQERHGFRKKTTAELWQQGTHEYPPALLSRSTDFDLLFGIVREGMLDHRGVVFQKIRYYSDDLHIFRYRHGDRVRVRVKVDPSDLRHIHIWEPREKAWIKAEAILSMRRYAQGLSLHRQKINLKRARETYGSDNAESLLRAEADIQALISESLPMALSIRSNNLIARAVGIGTQNLFDNLDADGNLGALTGPFAGKSLNPFSEPTNPGEIAWTASVKPSEAASNVEKIDKPRAVRNIPKMSADLSLTRRR